MKSARQSVRRFIRRHSTTLFLIIIATALAYAWGSTGHRIINRKAPMHLPASMSYWKADSIFYQNHASDADNRKNYSDTSFYAEDKRHYIDIDSYPNFHQLPHNRDSVIALYGWETVKQTGTLPWATVMVFDTLVAQYRRGDTAGAKQTMSDLGHYVADAHQPLHCTQNYDGAMTGNDGIHSRYETSMIGTYQSSLTISQDSARYVENPLNYVFDYIYHSNSYTDSIMAADNYAKTVSGWTGSGSAPPAYYTALWEQTGNFTKDQFQRATVAIASLWYTAWMNAVGGAATFGITSSVVGNGSISPQGAVTIPLGHDTTYVFTPQIGHHVDSVKVDGVKVDSLQHYTFHNVQTNHTITVWFGIDLLTIDASAGSYGYIQPSGLVSVPYSDSMRFTLNPSLGCFVDSLIVDGVYAGAESSYTFQNVISNHTIHAIFGAHIMTMEIQVADRWNLLSVPLTEDDYRVSSLFPTATAGPYSFDVVYNHQDTLRNGVGYWLKFSGSDPVLISGISRIVDTVSVKEGWNMIGSVSVAVPVSSITSDPGSVATSSFYRYENGYVISDSIKPGYGYWVKASQSARLFLGTLGGTAKRNPIQISLSSELPPPPPDQNAPTQSIPPEFTLGQNYPNPFNPSTSIAYQIPVESRVSLKIYNPIGQEVATLVNEVQPAGSYLRNWDASGMPSGEYFCRLTAGKNTSTRKLILLR